MGTGVGGVGGVWELFWFLRVGGLGWWAAASWQKGVEGVGKEVFVAESGLGRHIVGWFGLGREGVCWRVTGAGLCSCDSVLGYMRGRLEAHKGFVVWEV